MPVRQCIGTTKAGSRCLIKVRSGTFCHYHIDQIHERSSSTPIKVASSKSNSPVKASNSPVNQHTSPVKSPRSPIKVKMAATSVSPAKLNVKESKHHVTPSSTKSPTRSPRTSKVDYSKPGYIYVYTLASLLKNSKDGWLKTRNLLTDLKHKDRWVTFNSKALLLILVKVGMTTQTVAKRIQQWESKCHHELVCLHPQYPGPVSQPKSLMDRFRRLSLNSQAHSAQFRQYTTFQDSAKGFFVPRDVMRAEKEIHEALKQKFGRGDVYCTGCVEKAKTKHKESNLLSLFKKKDFMLSDYNVHVEWFPIPKHKLHEVYRIIDLICMRYLP